MKAIKTNKNILERIINNINKGKFNFESVMRKGFYYSERCCVTPLFCSYGQIGYKINTDFGSVLYDYEKNEIEIL